MNEQINPSWILPVSMTVEQAGRQANLRGCILKVMWSTTYGCRVVAVPRAPRRPDGK